MGGQCCWNISAGDNRMNNWPDMSYLESRSEALFRSTALALELFSR